MIKYINLEKINLGKIKNLIYTFNEKYNSNELLNINVISSDEIPGAIPAYVYREGNEFKIRYHISNEVILGEYLSDNIGKDDLINIIKEFIKILSKAEEKSININNYLLNIDNIYIDVDTKEISLVYIPLLNDDNNILDLKKYLKELLSNISYNLNDDLYFFVALHNYFNDKDSDIKDVINYINSIKENETSNCKNPFKLSNIKEDDNVDIKDKNKLLWEKNDIEVKAESIDIKKIDKNGVFTATNINIEDSIDNNEKPMAIHISTNSVNLENNNYYYDPCEKKAVKVNSLDYEEDVGTTVLDDEEDDYRDEESGGGTTLLGLDDEEEEVIPYLLRRSTKEEFPLNKSRVKVGREASSCDFVITNNKLVGRIHAIIIKQGQNYFIEDNNSTNGTFINGTKLSKMGKNKISHGDEIKLANEVFIFKLY